MKEAPSSALYLGIYEAIKAVLTTTSLATYPLLIYLSEHTPPLEPCQICLLAQNSAWMDFSSHSRHGRPHNRVCVQRGHNMSHFSPPLRHRRSLGMVLACA